MLKSEIRGTKANNDQPQPRLFDRPGDSRTRSSLHPHPLVEINLAINRTLKVEDGTKREEVTFVPITLWKRLGEIALEYLKKASPVFIEGWLELDAWQDKQSGQKQSPLRVVARNVQLLGRRPDFATSAPAPGPEASYVTGANLTVDGGMNA